MFKSNGDLAKSVVLPIGAVALGRVCAEPTKQAGFLLLWYLVTIWKLKENCYQRYWLKDIQLHVFVWKDFPLHFLCQIFINLGGCWRNSTEQIYGAVRPLLLTKDVSQGCTTWLKTTLCAKAAKAPKQHHLTKNNPMRLE